MLSVFSKLKSGLSKTRTSLIENIGRAIGTASKLDDDLFEELEEILILGDLGASTADRLIESLRDKAADGLNCKDAIVATLKQEMITLLRANGKPANSDVSVAEVQRPFVISIVGVNGTGKTTTIGKLANRYKKQGKRVLVAAADTFRAAAGDQLEVWAKRAGADIVRNQPGADPASVAFDALNAAKARDIDILIIDTAGRLHTKINLMAELEKIHRVLNKSLPGAPHQVLLVLDATTGQNGLNQAYQFTKTVGVSGIVLAKLDGTAKGGVVFSISHELGVPVQYIGLGEGIDDLEEFDPDMFVEALF